MRWAMAPDGLPQAHCSKGLPQEDCSEGLPQADCFNALTAKADPHPTPCGPRPWRHFAHPKHPIPHTPLKSPASLNPAAANCLRQKAPWRATVPGRILRVDQLAPWHRHRCDPHGPVGALALASLRSASGPVIGVWSGQSHAQFLWISLCKACTLARQDLEFTTQIDAAKKIVRIKSLKINDLS